MTTIQAMRIIDLYADDILRSDGFNLEKRFMQHGKVSVFKHSLAVAVTCVRLASRLRLRVDMRSLVRGALLHDYFLYDWHESDKSHRLHGFRHARRALKNAERDFTLNAIEKNMILSHMFPLNLVVPKCRESLILCLADKICAAVETVKWLKKARRKPVRSACRPSHPTVKGCQ